MAPVVDDISGYSSAHLDLFSGDDMPVDDAGCVDEVMFAAGGSLLDDERDSCQMARRSLHFEEGQGCVATAGVRFLPLAA